MGCLVVSVWRVGESLKIGVERIGQGLAIASNRIGENLRISAGLVCSVGADTRAIYFGKDVLVFTSEDNKVGTIKFNTLTAKGDWVLSEITIEELL